MVIKYDILVCRSCPMINLLNLVHIPSWIPSEFCIVNVCSLVYDSGLSFNSDKVLYIDDDWLTLTLKHAGWQIGKLFIGFIDPSQSVSRQESSDSYHHMIVIVESVTLKPGWLFMSADHCPHLTPCSCFLIMAVSQKAQNNQTMSVLNWPANSDV